MAMRPNDPAVAEWLTAGGWQIAGAPHRPDNRPSFAETDLDAVRAATLARIGVTEGELRAACTGSSVRTLVDAGRKTRAVFPPWACAHMGVGPGDSVEFQALADGCVVIRRAPDVAAIRARLRDLGIAPRLLSRLFDLPPDTVRRIVKGAPSG